ncbi:MAG: RHS repeat-associated core domain-containing protein [Deltaproteobacteria bacterium]|nr:RHS repeat-associated core domain-containing protein [Deltaproteobacteria bacterium]
MSYAYDESGRLVLAGSEEFFYDAAGNLAFSRGGEAKTAYVYENTLLREVTLPSGRVLRYTYDPKSPNPVGPVRKYADGALVMEYSWLDPFRLEACADHETGVVYLPHYDGRGRMAACRVAALRKGSALPSLFGIRGGEAVLFCVCDQVGTPKAVRDHGGRPVKHLWYDSFGNLLTDTRPELYLPVGFAGGLADKDTRLVRFGYRDYDPVVGRFTSPDPLGDTGGDHDVYDYCVDDPVSLVDPEGLNPRLYVSGAQVAEKVGRPLAKFMQPIAIGAQRFTQNFSNNWNQIGQTMIDKGVKAAQAFVEGAQRLHIASQMENKTGTMLRLGEKGVKFIEGAIDSSGVIPDSNAGKIGALAKQIYDRRDRIFSIPESTSNSDNDDTSDMGIKKNPMNLAPLAGSPEGFHGNVVVMPENAETLKNIGKSMDEGWRRLIEAKKNESAIAQELKRRGIS